jgi:hypothetical protein
MIQIWRKTRNGHHTHRIAGNFATNKYAKVKLWLAQRQRFKLHFTAKFGRALLS